MNVGLRGLPAAVARTWRTLVLGNPSGNVRGVGAVEIITDRTAATQVASGTNSVAIGSSAIASGTSATTVGAIATASALSAVAVGASAIASGNTSVAVGPSAGASASSAVAVGPTAGAGGASATAVGNATNASGNNSVAVGNGASGNGNNSVAVGNGASGNGVNSVAVGLNAIGGGVSAVAVGDGANANANDSLCVRLATPNSIIGNYAFAHSGDGTRGRYQRTELMLRASTTSTATTRLTSDGAAAAATNQLTLRNNSAFRPAQIDIVAFDTVANTAAAWAITNVLIKRGANAAATSLVGTPTVTTIQSDMATTPTVTVSADTTNGALAINVASGSANTTRYTAILRTTEVA